MACRRDHVVTDAEAVAAFLEHLRRRNLRPSTIAQRNNVLNRLRWAVGVELLAVDRATMDRWWARLTMLPEGRATELSHVRQFYKWAVLEELIVEDPTRRLIRPRLQRRLPRPISEAHLVRALASAPPRIRPWFYLAAYAGLRAAEIANVRREDILDRATPPMIIVTDGKGGKQRLIPLSPVVLDALRPMPARGWLFPREDGQPGPNAPWLISQKSSTYLHRIGIDASIHQLRHRFGTAIYAASKDLRVTQELMGHASPITTAGYAAYSPQGAVNAVLAI